MLIPVVCLIPEPSGEGEDRTVLMAAVDPAGCRVQPLTVGAPVPPTGKRWEERERRTPGVSDSPRNSSGWEGSGGRMCLGPPGPLTCHPSSPSGESLGWFPRLCLTAAIIYFWHQIPHAVPDFLCSTIRSLLQQPSPQKKAPERSKCNVSYYISKLLSVITLLKK